MKKLLKVLGIALCLILVISLLTGCVKKEEVEVEAEKIVADLEEKVETDLTTKQEEKKIERGIWANDVYTNDFAGITFNLPSGWKYSSDEEIAEMMNIGVDLLNEDQKELAKIAEQTSLYDMVAQDPTTGTSVMVMFEKTAIKVTTDFYIDKLKSGLEDVDSLNYSIGDVTTDNIAGETYTVLSTTVPAYNMVQKYYIKPEGNYFVVVLFTYLEGKAELNSILGNFE